MRHVFWALVLANLAYFAWARWVDVPRPPPVNETVSRLPRLKLASEEPPPPPQGSAVPERTSLGGTACLAVGPFRDADNSARAATLLHERGFEPHPRTEAGEPSTEYDVYVGGLKGTVEVTRTLHELQRAGFKDAAVVADEASSDRRIALGAFSERTPADERSRAARQSGFKAEVAERKSSGTRYWLDLTAPAGTATVPIQDLFAEGFGSQIAVRSCPVPAPSPPPAVAPAQTAASPSPPATAGISKVP
jgi:hypothetical protein